MNDGRVNKGSIAPFTLCYCCLPLFLHSLVIFYKNYHTVYLKMAAVGKGQKEGTALKRKRERKEIEFFSSCNDHFTT